MLSPILSVQDIEASIAFYTTKLGFEHAWSMPPGENGKTDFACVRFSGAEILLGTMESYVTPGDESKRGTGIELYIEVATEMDINTIYQHAQATGVNITRSLEDRDWGERTFHFQDPDGYRYMLAQRPSKD